MSDYRSDAERDARETVSEYREQIVGQLEEKGKASDDLFNDYPDGDSWHHECHVDKNYNLTNAAELIDELYEHEETDPGLWEGQQPKEAIGTCAAFTYGNAVYSEWHNLIAEINDEAAAVLDDYSDRIDTANEEEEDEDYDGPDSDDLRDEQKEALEVLIDRITNG